MTASFAYDGFGRRTSKALGGVTTTYLYDGQNFVQELTANTPEANVLTGASLDEVFLRNQSGISSTYLTDALGSTVGLTDSSGAMVTTYAYEPYGVATQGGAANDSAQQFAGRENDQTGLMYYRARYYIPTCGRFASEDPLGVPQGTSSYTYVNDSPINYVDPTGEIWQYVLPALSVGFGLFSGCNAYFATVDLMRSGHPDHPDSDLIRLAKIYRIKLFGLGLSAAAGWAGFLGNPVGLVTGMVSFGLGIRLASNGAFGDQSCWGTVVDWAQKRLH